MNREGHLLSSQYGFRKGHSTDIAVLDMVEKSEVLGRKGSLACFFFVDFKKVFDTVDHGILLAKLKHMGIGGAPLELLRSYLSSL